MQYVMIENNGEAPLNGLMVLGATTARGNESKIGQFGQGFLGSIILLLREKIDFKIYIGEHHLDFIVREEILQNKLIEVVYYTFQGKEYNTNICLEYGEIDWNDPGMAMREFISNALDQDKEVCQLKLQSPEGEKGKTRVFVQFVDKIREYVKDIKKYFLHFSYSEDKTLIRNTENRGPRIYRRGALVREITDKHYCLYPSLYDYNFQDMDIDECRNLNDSSAVELIGKEISNNEDLFVEVITAVINKQKIFEYERVSAYDLEDNDKQIIKWWKKHFDGILICSTTMAYNYAIGKGQTPLLLDNWYTVLKCFGVPVVDFQPLNIEKAGYTIVEPVPLLEDSFNKVWDRFEQYSLTRGKTKPELKMFEGYTDGNKKLLGEYRNGVVYINKDNSTSISTIVEEIAHYITDAYDCTLDFQTFLCDSVAALMKE